MSKRKEDVNRDKLRTLARVDANSKCFDCQTKGTTYVVSNFAIFTCSYCAGIHRNFQHRVKGISMTKITDEDLTTIKEGGNEKAEEVYLATFHQHRPKARDDKGLKEFVDSVFNKKTYKKKGHHHRHHRREESEESVSSDESGSDQEKSSHRRRHHHEPKVESVPAKPISELLGKDPPTLKVDDPKSRIRAGSVQKPPQAHSRPRGNEELLSFFDSPAQPKSQPPPQEDFFASDDATKAFSQEEDFFATPQKGNVEAAHISAPKTADEPQNDLFGESAEGDNKHLDVNDLFGGIQPSGGQMSGQGGFQMGGNATFGDQQHYGQQQFAQPQYGQQQFAQPQYGQQQFPQQAQYGQQQYGGAMPYYGGGQGYFAGGNAQGMQPMMMQQQPIGMRPMMMQPQPQQQPVPMSQPQFGGGSTGPQPPHEEKDQKPDPFAIFGMSGGGTPAKQQSNVQTADNSNPFDAPPPSNAQGSGEGEGDWNPFG